MDSFVTGGAAAGQQAADQASSEAPVQRRSGIMKRSASEPRPESAPSTPRGTPATGSLGEQVGAYREVTVYLPVELARQLALHCAQQNLELSHFARQALEARLPLGAAGHAGAEEEPSGLRSAARRSMIRLAGEVRASLETGGALRLRSPGRWLEAALAKEWLPARLLERLQANSQR